MNHLPIVDALLVIPCCCCGTTLVFPPAIKGNSHKSFPTTDTPRNNHTGQFQYAFKFVILYNFCQSKYHYKHPFSNINCFFYFNASNFIVL